MLVYERKPDVLITDTLRILKTIRQYVKVKHTYLAQI